ncbi:hypothetical protein, partial [Providencia vermicola]|uniref:hypothetical protein n=1 Tax=Providencia vermicola TaxID=333965 RepID=UPI0032DBABB1
LDKLVAGSGRRLNPKDLNPARPTISSYTSQYPTRIQVDIQSVSIPRQAGCRFRLKAKSEGFKSCTTHHLKPSSQLPKHNPVNTQSVSDTSISWLQVQAEG